MSEVVTADMIDDELVGRIYNETMFSSGYLSHSEPFIRSILAWLANNPIEMTTEDAIKLHEYLNDAPEFVQEFQRIAYLKKEDEFPHELINFSGCSPDIKAAILRGYKLGKESK